MVEVQLEEVEEVRMLQVGAGEDAPVVVPPAVEKDETIMSRNSGGDDDTDNSNDEENLPSSPKTKQPCYQTCMRFDGVKMCQGYNILGIARGSLLMSGIFIITALSFLANQHVGCVHHEDEGNITVVEEDENCDELIYGLFKPASLIPNIALVAGLLSAFLMPVVGAIVDVTPHRKRVGVATGIGMVLLGAIQIGLAAETWFFMAILLPFSWFFYDIQLIATYAYLPAMTNVVAGGEETMGKFTSMFFATLFSAQVIFLVFVVMISGILELDEIQTAQISQSLSVCFLSASFWYGWRLMPQVAPKKTLPVDPTTGKPRHSIWIHGFVELWSSTKRINHCHKKGLRWFFLATMFSEAAVESFGVLAIVYLDEEMGLSSIDIGLFFVVAMIAMAPGTYLSNFFSSRINPKRSYMLVMVITQINAIVGALTLHKDNIYPGGYIWAIFVGLCSGWYFPAQVLFFSMATPEDGHDMELSGLYSYCVVILAWSPHLLFTTMVEAGVPMQFGMVAISGFLTLGFLILLCFSGSWEEILEETKQAASNNAAAPPPHDSLVLEETTDKTGNGATVKESLSATFDESTA